jgi:hypothetical protein
MIISLLVIGFTLFGVKEILFKQNGLENSFQWIIIAFVLGYRTFEPFPGLKFHPIEIFIYASILRIIISGAFKYREISLAMSILGIFFIVYFFIDLLTRYHFVVLLEFKNAFLLILVFYITQHIYFYKAYVIRLLKYYLIASSIISILGITEYLFPSIMSSIFGFKSQSLFLSDNILFNRLAFLFWGSHLAANLIPPVFPILLLMKAEKDLITKNNYLLTLLVIINLFAIYLSGNRISWLVLTILLIATIFQYRSSLMPYMKFYALFIATAFVAYIYSQPVEGRYISTFKALTGNIDTRYDSSGGERIVRANIAINSIIKKPLGTGWGSQGWVHSDILQIGASIGALPGLILFLTPLFLLFRIYKCYLLASSDDQTGFFVCCGLLIFVIISLSLNGNIMKVQSGVPLIVLWAIADGYYRSYSQIGSN